MGSTFLLVLIIGMFFFFFSCLFCFLLGEARRGGRWWGGGVGVVHKICILGNIVINPGQKISAMLTVNSQTSMERTFLEPWNFDLDMDSSSH